MTVSGIGGAVPRGRRKRGHGAQPRPRGTRLAPAPRLVATGPTLMRQCDATARRSRDGARRRTPENGRADGAGGARGAVKAQKNVPRSPDATQRRQFRSPTTPSTHWVHPGASIRRYGSPIARRRARSRAAEPPKWPRGRRRRRARCRGGAKQCATKPRRDPEAPV